MCLLIFMSFHTKKNANWPCVLEGLQIDPIVLHILHLNFPSTFLSLYMQNIIHPILPTHTYTEDDTTDTPCRTYTNVALYIRYATRIISNIRYGFVSFHHKIQSIKPGRTVKTAIGYTYRSRSMRRWHVFECVVWTLAGTFLIRTHLCQALIGVCV